MQPRQPMGFSTRHIHNTEATMTDAPDPGLTDLIAAALVRSSPNSIDTFDDLAPHRQEAWRVRAREVALVVEQHTNGRATELEATIARVIEGAQMLIESFQRVERGGNHLYDASTHRCADNLALLLAEAQGAEHLRAALEGEQQ